MVDGRCFNWRSLIVITTDVSDVAYTYFQNLKLLRLYLPENQEYEINETEFDDFVTIPL